jgi:ribosomal protein S18 acetylase RimI-like enzyme
MTSVSPNRQVLRSLVELAYEKLFDFVVHQSHVILIAHEDARPLGFLLLLDSLPDEVSMAPQAFVAYMAVEPGFQRRGIGRALLNAAEEIARERGLPTIAMMVTEANSPALRLYETNGYGTERRLLCKPLA